MEQQLLQQTPWELAGLEGGSRGGSRPLFSLSTTLKEEKEKKER
jgi:hypothetical protein